MNKEILINITLFIDCFFSKITDYSCIVSNLNIYNNLIDKIGIPYFYHDKTVGIPC